MIGKPWVTLMTPSAVAAELCVFQGPLRVLITNSSTISSLGYPWSSCMRFVSAGNDEYPGIRLPTCGTRGRRYGRLDMASFRGGSTVMDHEFIR